LGETGDPKHPRPKKSIIPIDRPVPRRTEPISEKVTTITEEGEGNHCPQGRPFIWERQQWVAEVQMTCHAGGVGAGNHIQRKARRNDLR